MNISDWITIIGFIITILTVIVSYHYNKKLIIHNDYMKNRNEIYKKLYELVSETLNVGSTFIAGNFYNYVTNYLKKGELDFKGLDIHSYNREYLINTFEQLSLSQNDTKKLLEYYNIGDALHFDIEFSKILWQKKAKDSKSSLNKLKKYFNFNEIYLENEITIIVSQIIKKMTYVQDYIDKEGSDKAVDKNIHENIKNLQNLKITLKEKIQNNLKNF